MSTTPPPAAGTDRGLSPAGSSSPTSRITSELLHLAETRGPAATFCPSETARQLAGTHPDQWGPLMQPIRREAVRLALEGRLVIYRKGKPVDPLDFKGVYRLGMPRSE